jgi:hypothetical protein
VSTLSTSEQTTTRTHLRLHSYIDTWFHSIERCCCCFLSSFSLATKTATCSISAFRVSGTPTRSGFTYLPVIESKDNMELFANTPIRSSDIDIYIYVFTEACCRFGLLDCVCGHFERLQSTACTDTRWSVRTQSIDRFHFWFKFARKRDASCHTTLRAILSRCHEHSDHKP